MEFCVRARKSGVSLSYCESAVVKHHFDQGVPGLFRQFRRYGSFERQMCLKHPEYLNWLWASSEISCWVGLCAPGGAPAPKQAPGDGCLLVPPGKLKQ